MKNLNKLDKELVEIISQVIYEIRTSAILIEKYSDEKNNSDLILRQTILINNILDNVNSFIYLNDKSYKPSKGDEDIIYLIEKCINKNKPLFDSKRIKINFNTDKRYQVQLDRRQILNCISNILLFIFLNSKINSSISILSNVVDFENEYYIFFDGKTDMSDFLSISFNFEHLNIPESMKRKLFTKPLFFYNNSYSNNIILYNASRIIKKHDGRIWLNTKDNGESISILLPLEKV